MSKTSQNTLVILSSYNGLVLNVGYYDNAVEKLGGQEPSGDLREGKYSLFEVGTRVPFIIYWKGKIRSSVSDALVSLLVVLQSLASWVEVKGSDGGRDHVNLEASRRMGYREGYLVMAPLYKGPSISKNINIELGNSDEHMLFNIKENPGQQINLAQKQPKKLQLMIENFENVAYGYFNNVQEL